MAWLRLRRRRGSKADANRSDVAIRGAPEDTAVRSTEPAESPDTARRAAAAAARPRSRPPPHAVLVCSPAREEGYGPRADPPAALAGPGGTALWFRRARAMVPAAAEGWAGVTGAGQGARETSLALPEKRA